MATAERNAFYGWHYNIYFYNHDFTTEQLQQALDKTIRNKGLTPETFNLQPITHDIDEVCSYGTKEIKVSPDGSWESERFFSSEYLFGLSLKSATVPKTCAQDNNSSGRAAPLPKNKNCSLRTAYEWIIFWLICLLYLPRPGYNTS
jgi:hypothetical protein